MARKHSFWLYIPIQIKYLILVKPGFYTVRRGGEPEIHIETGGRNDDRNNEFSQDRFRIYGTVGSICI